MAENAIKETADFWKGAIESEAETNPDVEVDHPRKGRPKGSSQKSSTGTLTKSEVGSLEVEKLTAEEVEPLVKSLGNAVCRAAAVSEIEEDESKEISEALAPVLSKYFGAAVNRYGPEIVFLGVIVKVTSPRVQEYREKAKIKEVAESGPGPEFREHFGKENEES